METKNNQIKAQMKSISKLGDYINGSFRTCNKPDVEWTVKSPADLKDTVGLFQAQYSHIDEACSAAQNAFRSWAHLSMEKRFQYLRRLQELFQSHASEMAEIISRETGKPLWEGLNEAKGLASKIAVTLDFSIQLVKEQKVESALPGVDGFIRYKPRGVMAVVGPFNFPAHLPNGHIIPALAAGNTIVFKPSDKTPGVGQFMAEMFHKAEFPKGVFNLIQGKGETGKRLAIHEKVDGVLFTGSYDVGLKIKSDTLNHHWKLLALEMGGKNVSIVWEDCDFEKALYESIVGSFLTTGQRCSCTSKILVHRKIRDQFVDRFYQVAKKLKIGHWSESVFMGPLISAEAVENYIRFQEIAKREGAESIMRGKVLETSYEGYYVTPSIYSVDKHSKDSVYQKSEIFGPNVAILAVDDFDHALEITNSTGYGLVTSLFSKDKRLYEQALLDAKVGLVNWNRTTNGGSSKLPFGGMGKSGNDRPSGHFAIQYCTIPVASLEDYGAFNANEIMPGIVLDGQA